MVAIPANEIVIPTILMLSVMVAGVGGAGSGAGVMFELDSLTATADLLKAGGFTLLIAINSDALQPGTQPLLDHHLHHLEGDPERQVDSSRLPPARSHGVSDLHRGRPTLASRSRLTRPRPLWLASLARRSAADRYPVASMSEPVRCSWA